MDKIVFVAGGVWQKPFVTYLKNKGHFVAVVNPVVTPTTQAADYHIRADVNDVEEINKHIADLGPVFITSDQSDISTLTVARLSQHWNLPGNSVEVIDRFTNKFRMYTFGKSISVPVPVTRHARSEADIRAFAAAVGFPVIIKPVDATMSRGFCKFDSDAEITQDALDNALRFSKSKSVIVQKFVPGYMVTLEGVCSGGKHRTIATSKKDEYFKPGITSGVRYPSRLPAGLLAEIVATNDRYVEAAEMAFGLTHSEYMVNDNGFWLIEIGGRGGGAGITDKIVPWVSGINPYDVLYQSLLGNTVDVKALSVSTRPALLKYYQIEEMANCTEEKAEVIRGIPGVAEFQYNFIGKQYVSDPNDSRHTMGIYLADDEAGLQAVADRVLCQSQ